MTTAEKAADAVLSAVEDLLPVLRERAQEAEDARRIPVASIKALQEIGFFKLLQPSRFGGHEADPMTFYTAVRQLASACGSTGWVASVLGVPQWNLALFDPRAQTDVWDEDPDARICSSYALTGTATPVPGGYRLSGRWGFASGCDHTSWALLGGKVIDDGVAVESCTFLVPLRDFAIEDVWHAVGLRGTGSNDILVEDAFVPDHRVLNSEAVTKCVTPGQEVNDAALYRIPFGAIHPNSITAAVIGMAQGGYETHLAHQRGRVRVALPGDARKETGFAGTPFAQDTATLERIAQAASEIDAAWLQLTRNTNALLDLARQHRPIPMLDRARTRRDQVRGTERSIFALDRLFENSGGRALRSDTALQRFWRDAHAGRAHAANDPERAYRMFGTAELTPPVANPAPSGEKGQGR
ncbi:3-hydroxy-9,10-secoandrosta-1,3,5(10)-triene-9,17-dione monooxygenase oxygenase subunit [Nocardia sp. CDC160]|uniref:3-hydroxy-9,10-secoandrosta-1,3,5(10)-triene-9, 17-dione monooxygenase oxygenase subunit n=1 Tax=Nocardia sp. CDC160 TaxID=3112166 RepID=UPI002DBA0572|nr:3-hydroxy-9,10-secoandrosta-1,3,5(10)-triene-9,17-dione monooxygenase oxygenase subunit [Nocardia sp. CDC160]MEC3915598.1 flavin-dependent monooxygenase [Nocardia sp. CDC160]